MNLSEMQEIGIASILPITYIFTQLFQQIFYNYTDSLFVAVLFCIGEVALAFIIGDYEKTQKSRHVQQ